MSLEGKRVVVTRAVDQQHELVALLEARGAITVPYPCIAIVPPADVAPLDGALRRMAANGFDWLVLTSTNTVAALAQRCGVLGLTPDSFMQPRIAAVGGATAAAASAWLQRGVDVVSDKGHGDDLGGMLELRPGERVFLPQSAIAKPTLAEALSRKEAVMTVVDAYTTGLGTGGEDVPALLAAGQIDAVTFTSGSTVENFLARLHSEGGMDSLPAKVCIACIGAPTARAAREFGLTVHVVAERSDLAVMVQRMDEVDEGDSVAPD